MDFSLTEYRLSMSEGRLRKEPLPVVKTETNIYPKPGDRDSLKAYCKWLVRSHFCKHKLGMPSPQFSAEIHRRAAHFLPQRSLLVDFYRIRQRLAIPLPLSRHPTDLSSIREFPAYPYAIWALWTLEERILSLGWEVELNGSAAAQAAVERDLMGLHRWKFLPEIVPHLWSPHMVRILVTALHWSWPDGELRAALRTTLIRLVEHFASAGTPKEPSNHIQFANIPIIVNLGWAIGATEVAHASAGLASTEVMAKLRVWLDQGMKGHGEGVCYDGYVADFLMDFIRQAPDMPDRKALLGHRRLTQILEEIVGLGAPGHPENLALIGDVEPEQMLFHYSFAAKFFRSLPGSVPFVAPRRLLRIIRCDGLPHLPTNGRLSPVPAVPAAEPEDAHYALVWNLRPKRLRAKAIVAWNNSAMGHLHCDAGHLVVAVGGHWMVTDPGYQQYLQTSEREFTLGPSAHNVPVINGCQATKKPATRATSSSDQETHFDLTSTYPAEAGVRSVRRSLRVEKARIVVRDQITAEALNTLDYSWHANPQAFLRVEDGRGVIVLENHELEIRCEKRPLVFDEICRLRGSRGSLTFRKTITLPAGTQTAEVEWEFVWAV